MKLLGRPDHVGKRNEADHLCERAEAALEDAGLRDDATEAREPFACGDAQIGEAATERALGGEELAAAALRGLLHDLLKLLGLAER